MARSISRARNAAAATQWSAPVRVRNVYPVRDGWVVVSPGIVPPVAAFMRRLMSWAVEEGLCDAQLVDWDWGSVALRMVQGAITQQQWQVVDEAIARVLAPRTKLEVMAQAVSRKLLIGAGAARRRTARQPAFQRAWLRAREAHVRILVHLRNSAAARCSSPTDRRGARRGRVA